VPCSCFINPFPQSIATVLLFLPMSRPPPSPFYEGKTTFQKWLSLDWIGAFISIAMITCLLLPIQWGGSKYAWNDRIIIALFCTVRNLPLHIVALLTTHLVCCTLHPLYLMGVIQKGPCNAPALPLPAAHPSRWWIGHVLHHHRIPVLYSIPPLILPKCKGPHCCTIWHRYHPIHAFERARDADIGRGCQCHRTLSNHTTGWAIGRFCWSRSVIHDHRGHRECDAYWLSKSVLLFWLNEVMLILLRSSSRCRPGIVVPIAK
jgi:hypothetical protein